MGTSEIYRAVLAVPEVVDALVVDVPQPGEENWMPLFVVLREGAALDDDLVGAIRRRVREDCSPRHVPSEVREIAEVPRTLSGKVLEVPVKRILMGEAPGEGREPRLARQPRGARRLRRDGGVVTRDLAFAGLAAAAELIRAEEVSSRELTELYLERIARLDPRPARLPGRARRGGARGRRRRGRPPAAGDAPPLNGVPIAIKDDTDVAGQVTMRGSLAHDGRPAGDAEVVRRLRAAGCVILGKTHVPELEAMCATESLAFGATRNPWDPARTSGGSSGGSGTAVAAGPRGGGARHGRRGLDPHPRGRVRPLRPQAAARPAADARGLERALGDGLPHARRAGHRAVRRRRGGHGLGAAAARRRPAGCGSPSR